jgi:glycosyltransferase domain-containing protein
MTVPYTLVIPTYNRPTALAALLRYLERERAGCRILVADSSREGERARNRRTIGTLALDLTYLEFDTTTPPFDKFRDAVHRVETPFCGLCADDDLVVLPGVRRCVAHLAANDDIVAAHGYYFTFIDGGHGDGGMDLHGVLYYTPSLDASDPLERLHSLFRNYQALTYATYRTTVLQHVFETVSPVESLLGRELLSGAVTAVAGKTARLPCFTNGRSLGSSEAYRHWHPMEWLIESPSGLLAEYLRYRDILMRELTATSTGGRSVEATVRIVDLVHVFYLLRHLPVDTYDLLLSRVLAGQDVTEVWRHPEVQHALIRASGYLAPGDHPGAASPASGTSPATSDDEHWPVELRSRVRSYWLHRGFMRPEPRALVQTTDDDVRQLVKTMNSYRAADVHAP